MYLRVLAILTTFFLNYLVVSSATAQSIQQIDVRLFSKSVGMAGGEGIRTSSLNINNLWLHLRNDGRLGTDSTHPANGLSYPMFQGNVLYADHPFWVGKVSDGQMPVIRTGGGTYAIGTGVRPGAIVSQGIAENPLSESVRVFRFRPDYQNGDLTFDAAASNGIAISSVTSDLEQNVRKNYAKDLAEWPWQKGAPFIDANHNGSMDAGELPGIEHASQLAWLSYNDLDEAACKLFAGDPPIGLEVQVTLWAYKDVPNLEDVIFKRYRIIYKGTSLTPADARIDSMYLSHWFDPDIGNGNDDLGGCDTLLDLAYAYNGTYNGDDQDRIYKSIGSPTPGLGYTILQGPLVADDAGGMGIFDFKTRAGIKNLHMSSCGVHITGLGDGLTDLIGLRSYFYWNMARGFRPTSFDNQTLSSSPWLDEENKPSKFMFYGDPVSRTGWFAARPTALSNLPPINPDFPGGDVRIYMNLGPFTMALRDTQEIVVAMIASAAPTSVQNATWLKNRAIYVRSIYPNLGNYVAQFVSDVPGALDVPLGFTLDQNFPNPFNPSTHIQFTIPHESQVKLSVIDVLGRLTNVLFDGPLQAGTHAESWDGRNASGQPAPSGVYIYVISTGERQLTRKMILLR